jgi:hypothetical protein
MRKRRAIFRLIVTACLNERVVLIITMNLLITSGGFVFFGKVAGDFAFNDSILDCLPFDKDDDSEAVCRYRQGCFPCRYSWARTWQWTNLGRSRPLDTFRSYGRMTAIANDPMEVSSGFVRSIPPHTPVSP